MKEDPVENKMRELTWRRELTGAEKAELQAWLATHPEAQADWKNETELSELLSRLPDLPVPSNFTARVLQAVEIEATAPSRAQWWRVLVPRMAVAALVVGTGFFALQQYQSSQRQQMAKSLMVATDAEVFSNPAILQDFDAIRRLTLATAPDTELLALLQ